MRQSCRDVLSGVASRFRRDQSGATVTMFAFAGVVLIGMAGVVLDYGRLTKAHSSLQAATDSAALAAGAIGARASGRRIVRRFHLGRARPAARR